MKCVLIMYKQGEVFEAQFMIDTLPAVISHWFDITDETHGLVYYSF